MTPRERVLKRYPEAYSAWSSLYGEWRIYNKVGGRIIAVSYSHNAAKAWAGVKIRATSTRTKGR